MLTRFCQNYFLGIGFAKTSADFCFWICPHGGEIRYERKSIIFLWIAVFGFMLHHHPDNIDQLTAQADQGLRFCFALGYFSFEIPSGRVIARP